MRREEAFLKLEVAHWKRESELWQKQAEMAQRQAETLARTNRELARESQNVYHGMMKIARRMGPQYFDDFERMMRGSCSRSESVAPYGYLEFPRSKG